MAEKKMRKFETWRIKWCLLYIALVLLFIGALVASIFFFDDGIFKICVIVYEAIVVIVSISIPIAIIVNNDQDSKNKRGISNKKKTAIFMPNNSDRG